MADTADRFRHAFRGHPAAVAIITATTPAGPVGLTASSVASVSAAPPALSFSVMKSDGSAGGLLEASSVAVNLLGPEHVALAEAFARSGDDRFKVAQEWGELASGEPSLLTAPAVLRARVTGTLASGSSRLVLAEVLAVDLGEERGRLLYQGRVFHPFAAGPDAVAVAISPRREPG